MVTAAHNNTIYIYIYICNFKTNHRSCANRVSIIYPYVFDVEENDESVQTVIMPTLFEKLIILLHLGVDQ